MIGTPLLGLLLVGVTSQSQQRSPVQQLQQPVDGQQPQKRKKFMESGVVEHKVGGATITANSPRPLEQAISALNVEYGWTVDYEDPPYTSDSDLVDDTDPQWRAGHPNSRGVRRVAGGTFQSQYEEGPGIDASGSKGAVLQKIVSDYNRSGNPGTFVVRAQEEGHYAIIGASIKDQARQDQKVTPTLDTPISIPIEQRSAEATIELILKVLSSESGKDIGLVSAPLNLLINSQVTVGGANVPARTLLLQTLNATKRPLIYSLLYDADARSYLLNIVVAMRAQRDTYGGKRLVPVDGLRTRPN
jgi:hypothetical protein